MSTLNRLAGAAILAAAGAYFLDPENGRRRRAMALERIAAMLRGRAADASSAVASTATQATDEVKGAMHGAKSKAQPEREAPNDAELAHRVETEAFRAADVPTGSISVNAEMGVVYFRGEIEGKERRAALIAAAQQVDGVRAVEDMLHAPGEAAEAKQETDAETRRRVEKNPVRSGDGKASGEDA